MPYEQTEAQKRFLRKRYAKLKEEETGCDCPGCEKCKGFVRNCTCDHDTEWLKMKYGSQENRQGMADQGPGGSTGNAAPDHVNPEAYRTFGF